MFETITQEVIFIDVFIVVVVVVIVFVLLLQLLRPLPPSPPCFYLKAYKGVSLKTSTIT